MVDHPASMNRAMPWLVFLHHASGESYYQTVARLPTAWTDQAFYGGNGDGTLFYPGTPDRIGGHSHVPLPSVRLKLLRAGVQDYEWLKRVAEGGDPAFAEQVARQLLPTPHDVTLDPDAFDRARESLIHRALELATPQPQNNPAQAQANPAQPQSGGGCGSDGAQALVLLMGVAAGFAWTLPRRSARAGRPAARRRPRTR